MKSNQFSKKSIPKPIKKGKKLISNNISKRKLSFSRDRNLLLNKYSNSQKSTSRSDLINVNNIYNITSYPSSKIINNDFPKRKSSRAKTYLQKFEKKERKDKILKLKRKKVKNLELFIKLVDENEKIQNELYHKNNSKNKKMKFKRNKSDIGLYNPCITYDKKNIFFNKKYDLIQKNCKYKNNTSFKYFSSYSCSKDKDINNKLSPNYSKEKEKRNFLKLTEKKEKDKINIPKRKKIKSNTMILNNISPYLHTNNDNFIYKQLNLNKLKLNKKNLSDASNSLLSNDLFKTELNNNINKNTSKSNRNISKITNNYSYNRKSLSPFSKSKSKEKLRRNKIFPLVSKIIEESSKIDEGLKNIYKNLNDNEKKERDKKKKIIEINNITKIRKINIDLIRKKLNLDKNYFERNKKHNYFDIYDILTKNTNKIKKIIPKNGINIINEAVNKIIYEDKMLHKDIVYYNNKLLGHYKENKKDKLLNKIFENQKIIKKEIIGKYDKKNEKFQSLKSDIMD